MLFTFCETAKFSIIDHLEGYSCNMIYPEIFEEELTVLSKIHHLEELARSSWENVKYLKAVIYGCIDIVNNNKSLSFVVWSLSPLVL